MMAAAIRVLYVDDEPGLLEIGKLFLERSGDFSVATIVSASAAIELLKKEQFDAIISDYQMPGMDGIQFLIEVRAKIGSIPFILFTGKGREDVVIQAINSGADFYLQKGGEPGAQFAELVHKIKQAASRKRAEDSLAESERVHATMISNLPGFVYRCANDSDWTMEYLSDGCREITGYAPDELLNNKTRTYNDLVHPEFQKSLWDKVQNFLEKKEVIEVEYPIITKTGETRWVWERGRGICSEDGRLLYLEGFITDITVRKQAESERTEYQTRLKEVIEFLPDATLAIDRQKRIIVWNKAIEQMTGIPAAEMIGKGDHAYAVPFYGEARQQLMDLVFEDSEEIAARYPTIRHEGDTLIAEVFCNALYNNKGAWVYAKASPLYDSYGNIVGAIESIRDITDRRRAEVALRILAESRLGTEQDLFRVLVQQLAVSQGVQYALIARVGPEDNSTAHTIAVWAGSDFGENFSYALDGTPCENVTTNRICFYPSDVQQMFPRDTLLADMHAVSYWGTPLYDNDGQVIGILAMLDVTPMDAYPQTLAILESFAIRASQELAKIDAEDALLKNTEELHAANEQLTASEEELRQNVDDLSRTEQALRQSEQDLKEAQAIAQLGRWELDILHNTLHWSDGIYQIFEINFAEFRATYEAFLACIHPDDRDAVNAAYTDSLNTKKPYEIVHRLLMKDGRIKWVNEICRTEYDSRGQPLRSVGIVQDITKIKVAEDALAREKTIIDAIFDSVPGMIYLYNAEGQLVRWNKKHEQITGYTPEELSRMQLLDWYKGDTKSQNAVIEGVKTTMQSGFGVAEADLQKKDGTKIPMYFTASPLTIGGKQYFAGLGIDITERRQAEKKLSEREEKYRTIFENAGDAIAIHDLSGHFTEVNDIFCRRYGYSREELLTMTVGDIDDPVQARNMEGLVQELIKNGHAVFETVHITRDGRRIPTEASAVLFHLGDQPFVMSIARDITGRKLAEEALLKNTEELHAANEQLTASEEELKSQFDSLAESEGRVRKKLESLLSPGGDIGMLDLGDIIDPQVLQRLMEDFTRVSGMATAILDTKGTVLVATGWQEICTKFHRVNPVTAGFCTESDLHLAKNMKQGEYVAYHCRNHLWDVVTPLYIGSNHMGNIFSGQFFYDDDIVDESVFIRQAEKYGFDRDAYLAALHQVPKFSRQKISELMDYLVKLTDFISLLSYRNLELARTVTERNNLLTSLQKSEGKFRTLVENIPQKIFLKDLDSRYVTVNENFARDLGISPEEMAGKTDADLFPAEFAASYRAGDIRVLETGKTDDFEERYLVDGKETWVHTIKTVVKDDGGEVVGLFGVFWDVTDRKRAEEALRMSEVQFRSYVDSAPEGIFIADEKGYYTFVNDAACIMTGYTREELLSKNLVDVIFPEDIPKAGEHFQRIVTTGSASGELRFITRSGEVRWWVVKGVRLSPTRFLGFVSDTTYRKRIEDALRESEGKYRSLFNQSTEGICVHDLEGRIHDVNEMACTQSGYSREELLSRTVFDGHPGQSTTFPPKAEILRTWDQWAPGQRFVIEAEHQRKDGTVFPVEISMGVVQYGNEKAILALIKDITERKVAEEKLLETTEYLQNLFDYANAPIIVWDPEYVITRFNHAFEDLTLISEQEVLGQRLDILFPEDSRDTSLHEIKKTLEGERWETVEIPILVKDGSVRMVLWNSANILDLHGRIISTVAQGVDITERKVVEEALQLKNFAIESSINAIAIADMAGNLTNVNTAFLSIWGYEHQQEVLGQSVLSFWKVPHEAQQVVDGIQAQGTWTGEMTGQRKDGTPIPVQLSANLIRDVSGMPVAMMGSFIDITERKQAEGTLHQANKKLNLLSSITRHDINNQLTVLRGYLAILEKKQPDPSLTEYFGKVSTAAQRISSMIQFTKEYENIGVNAPVWQDCKTAIETAAKQAPLGKVVVKNDLPDCTEVFSDPLIVKVFYNLMDNAVQHGGKITTIWFSFEECNCDHLIVCEDDGDGVPAEEKEKIFEKGYGKNTGMGLFLAREILDITGITIRETGEHGKGARFEMVVPEGAWRRNEMAGDGKVNNP